MNADQHSNRTSHANAAAGADAPPSLGQSRFALLLSLLIGVGLPLLFYLRSVPFRSDFFFPMPPHRWAWGAIAAMLAGGAALGLASAAVARRWGNRPAVQWAMRAFWIALCGALLWRWQFKALVGDGRFWAPLANDPYIMGSEPLGRWTHWLAYRAMALFGRADGETAVRAASVAAGMAWLGAILLLGRGAFRRLAVGPAALFLFVAPTSMVYAAFVETTPWAYAFTGMYLLAALRYLRLGPARPPWPETALLALAVWCHGMVCFASGAHAVLIVLWLMRSRGENAKACESRLWGRALLLAIAPFAPLGLTLLAAWLFGTGHPAADWHGNALGGHDGLAFVALGEARSDMQYVLFSTLHVTHLINLILWMSPMLVLAPAALARLWRRRRSESLFLSGALAGLLLFLIAWNPDFGMQWDFDLMAMFALPAQMIVALWWDEELRARHQKLAAVAAALACFLFLMMPFLRFP